MGRAASSHSEPHGDPEQVWGEECHGHEGSQGEDAGVGASREAGVPWGGGGVPAGPLWQMEGERLSQEQPFDGRGQGDRCPGHRSHRRPITGLVAASRSPVATASPCQADMSTCPNPSRGPPPATRSPRELRPEVALSAAEEARPCSRVPLSTSAGSGVPEPKAWRVGCLQSL